jgi:hypothetical protein
MLADSERLVKPKGYRPPYGGCCPQLPLATPWETRSGHPGCAEAADV